MGWSCAGMTGYNLAGNDVEFDGGFWIRYFTSTLVEDYGPS